MTTDDDRLPAAGLSPPDATVSLQHVLRAGPHVGVRLAEPRAAVGDPGLDLPPGLDTSARKRQPRRHAQPVARARARQISRIVASRTDPTYC